MLNIVGTADRLLALTAIPDERKGERLMVLHLSSLQANKKEILTKLSEKGIPNLWIPGERDFFQVEELPVLGTGKLDLKKLKDLALEIGKKS
jgi:acyl-[acyl-carrier-protein]-phospholipid O-acyltransferase/long-chain-fatty-acid--[acyl-carrier-protein] ligase